MYKIAMTTHLQNGSQTSFTSDPSEASGGGSHSHLSCNNDLDEGDEKADGDGGSKASSKGKSKSKSRSKSSRVKTSSKKDDREEPRDQGTETELTRAESEWKADDADSDAEAEADADEGITPLVGKMTIESKGSANRSLPPLFVYMEAGAWGKATERAKRHPRDLKAWAVLKSKSVAPTGTRDTGTKRLALHHACFKLRTVMSSGNNVSADGDQFEDPFVEVCKFIMVLLELYPDAAGTRETRHGCLPLHLAAFASCTIPARPSSLDDVPSAPSPVASSQAIPPSRRRSHTGNIPRPGQITSRSVSESTTDTARTNLSAMFTEEKFAGAQSAYTSKKKTHRRVQSAEFLAIFGSGSKSQPRGVSVSMGTDVSISERREDMVIKVLNALLDAFPRAIRMDSEGGRLPLHTACAGRATPRIISTLVTAYPAAARHRNRDGFLPLHLAAHWGISHPNVAVNLLKAYPDATFGRNRWERTPLEEALVMAGENGRPHQSVLVRALRKHPSYWTRPADIFMNNSPLARPNQIVDIDASLPSTVEELTGANDGASKPRSLFRKGKKGEEARESPPSPFVSLPTLIRSQDWGSVLSRLERSPADAKVELNVTTRGGFVSASGFFPLHYALERRPPQNVVESLIAAYPDAVNSRTMPGGFLPLHAACTWGASVTVVDAILKADRAGCKMADELGNIALHCSCFSGTDLPIIETLLRAYPKSVLIRNHQGSLPEDIVGRLRHKNRDSVAGILNVCKEEILLKKHRKTSSGLPNQAAIDVCDEKTRKANLQVDEIDYKDSGLEVEVTYGQDSQDLVWI